MFETAEKAKQQILRDKHTLLEGYVTEYLFEEQFLKGKNKNYTSGWWSAVRGNNRFFFLVKEKMNDVDFRVFQELSKKYPCWIAFPEGNEWFFQDDNIRISKEEFVSKYELRILRDALNAADDTRNIQRQNQCVHFFEEKGIEKKIAVERNFADDFLTVYFNSMVNIDFITLNAANQLCVMEVKFKYEDRAGKFGINSGQVQMFSILASMGFEIHHMILYNHKKDKTLSIFGFLRLYEDKYWLYGKLSGFDNRKLSVAPKETSVDGKTAQLFMSFGMNEVSQRFKLIV